jgi:hypothetical protein
MLGIELIAALGRVVSYLRNQRSTSQNIG